METTMNLTQKNWSKVVAEMNDVIDEIYGKRNKRLYLEKVNRSREFPLAKSVEDFCRANRILFTFYRIPPKLTSNDWSWKFDLPKYKDGAFKSEYSTTLCVSKLCNVFCLFNRFEMTDVNPDAMYPIVEGEGHAGGPATNLQDKLCRLLIDWLERQGYVLLRDWVYNQVVVGLENLEGKEFHKEHPQDAPPEAYFCTYYDVFFHLEYDDVGVLDYYYAKREYEKAPLGDRTEFF